MRFENEINNRISNTENTTVNAERKKSNPQKLSKSQKLGMLFAKSLEYGGNKTNSLGEDLKEPMRQTSRRVVDAFYQAKTSVNAEKSELYRNVNTSSEEIANQHLETASQKMASVNAWGRKIARPLSDHTISGSSKLGNKLESLSPVLVQKIKNAAKIATEEKALLKKRNEDENKKRAIE